MDRIQLRRGDPALRGRRDVAGDPTPVLGITVADADTRSLTVTLTPIAGLLSLGATTGITVTEGVNGVLAISGANYSGELVALTLPN